MSTHPSRGHMSHDWLQAITASLKRAKGPILWITCTYLIGLAAGAAMVHAKNAFALQYRDNLVGTAMATDPAAVALTRGLPLRAALIDFAGNLVLGAVPSTVMGLTVALSFPLA